MSVGTIVIQSGDLTFYVTPEKLIVCTSLQTFLLRECEYYWRKKLINLRGIVLVNGGDITHVSDLAEWLVVKDANGNVKGRCIEMIPYKKDWL